MLKNKPKLLVIAGPNGSGKTTVTTQILKHEWVEGCVYINPDNIAQEQFGDWNSPEAVLKAAKLATEQRENCLQNQQSFIFETVFSAMDKVDFLQKAKAAGFFIRLFFVGTDHPSINASRIVHRVMGGGHDVPISKIVKRYYKSIANCSLSAPFGDRLYVYDNSINYADAKLLFRASDGKTEKTYNNVNDWALPIFGTLTANNKNNIMNVCLAENADLQGIINLQKQNLPSALTPDTQKTQGFVTVAHTYEILERMNSVTKSVIVRNENEEVVAYCLAMLHSFGLQIPELVPLFEMIDDIVYKGVRLGSVQCIYCGQICVGDGYRGQGLFDEMYAYFRTTYERDYPFIITEIASRNTRSLRAHERVGFQPIHEYTAPDGEVWTVVLWNWTFLF